MALGKRVASALNSCQPARVAIQAGNQGYSKTLQKLKINIKVKFVFKYTILCA